MQILPKGAKMAGDRLREEDESRSDRRCCMVTAVWMAEYVK